MKNILNKVLKKTMTITSSFALTLALMSITNLCFFWLHQPDVPSELMEKTV
jgi:hypothetical protein